MYIILYKENMNFTPQQKNDYKNWLYQNGWIVKIYLVYTHTFF